MTQHRAPWRGQMRKRQRVGRRAGWNQKDRDLALEEFGETPLHLLGPVVIAVAEGIAGVGAADRLKDRGGNSGCVVACEVHARPRVNQSSFCGLSGERNAILLRCGINHVPLVTCTESAGQQTPKEADLGSLLLRMEHDLRILGQYYC